MRAAPTATDARSMRPVASSAPAIACTVASQPLVAAWSRMRRSSALRSGFPRESMCSRKPSGMALLTLLFAHAPGRWLYSVK